MKVKTRFAPSPTGFLHVGSARTALFNWLYARHNNGTFILRVEDTDKERSKKEFEEEIVESLKWLGLDWDGELTYQSKRLDIHKQAAKKLVDQGLAYEDDGAIRFKSPKTMISWEDAVRGKIEFDGKLFDDLVIMKSDGSPTYNFACVVDDAEMGITHVIRGEDHISNTPKQLPLYESLGYNVPIFAHIPLILGEDRSRLSKRHGATSVRDFRLDGYLPDAMVNYLSLLGWSPGNDQEIIGLKETVEKFTIERVLSTGAIFNIQKMDWMNGEYIRALPSETLKKMFFDALEKAGVLVQKPDDDWQLRFVELYRKRVFLLKDLVVEAAFFFTDSVEWDEAGEEVLAKTENMADVCLGYADTLQNLDDFGHEAVEKASRDYMKERGLSGKKFIHPSRVAITGRLVSPGFFETVSLLGKEKSVKRLRQAAQKLSAFSKS